MVGHRLDSSGTGYGPVAECLNTSNYSQRLGAFLEWASVSGS